MASTSNTRISTKSASTEKTTGETRTTKDREADLSAKRKYDHVPADLPPKGRLLRIHTQEDITRSPPGRIIKEWTKCEKPATEPNRACRTGRMGYWVETDEGYKAVLVCKRKVCDWQPGAGVVDDEEHERDGEEGETDGD